MRYLIALFLMLPVLTVWAADDQLVQEALKKSLLLQASKVDVTRFQNYSGRTQLKLNQKISITKFSTYSTATQGKLNQKLDKSTFASYTSNERLPTSIFSNYTTIDRLTPTSTHTLTNKTINDLSNYVDADAIHFKIYNNSGGALTRGQAVYGIQWNSGAGAMEVSKARANSAATMPAMCLVEDATIADGGTGECRITGTLNGANTSTWSDGVALYVSATTAGALTTTKPTGTTELVQRVGTSVRQSATVGVIAVFNPDFNVLNKKFIIQTTDADLPNAQAMGALATGIVKNTTATGVQSIAVAGDFPTLNQNTTGSAATLTTARTINGVSFNGSANIQTATASTSDYATNTWTPTFTNLTLGAPSTVNLTGTYTAIGNMVWWKVYVQPTGGTTTSAAGGAATYHDLPPSQTPNGQYSSTVANAGTGLGIGIGQVGTTYHFVPAWTATTSPITLQGWYQK